jgi:hypothetical protein
VIVCGPEQLEESLSRTVHRLLFKMALGVAGHDDDEPGEARYWFSRQIGWRAAAVAATFTGSTSRISLQRFSSANVRAIPTSTTTGASTWR